MNRASAGIAAGIVLTCLLAHGAAAAANDEPATAVLSAETRVLLIREMQALAESMTRIHRALLVGDHATIAAEAKAIHDSFVLAQELTEDQRQEIRGQLPRRFLALDQELHRMAAELATAAQHGSPHVERFWFAEMTRACQGCHAAFAGGRFPGLVQTEKTDREEH